MTSDDKPIWREPVPWIAAAVWFITFCLSAYPLYAIRWPMWALPPLCFANLLASIVFAIGSTINLRRIRD